jgi:glucokinase
MNKTRRISDHWLRTILTALYERREVTRAQIVRSTQLNVASVSLALKHLLSRGVILRIGTLQSTGGRRREVLKLNAEAGYFVTADLEGESLRFAVTNLVGDIRYRWAEDIEIGKCLDIDRVADGVQRLLDKLDHLERPRVIAVGISCPGYVEEGAHVSAVNLGWTRVPLLARLRKRISLPIFLEGSGRIAALAERWLGVAKNSDNFVYVVFGAGVGLSGFIDGKLLRGFKGLGGELGHITIDPDAQERCNCGKQGCLEAIVSSSSVVRQYLASKGHGHEMLPRARLADVFEAARRGDSLAQSVLDRMQEALTSALSFVTIVLSPEVIVLGGDLTSGEDLLLPRIREGVLRNIPVSLRRPCEVKMSALGLDIGLKGAASLAFHESMHDPKLLREICRPPLERHS